MIYNVTLKEDLKIPVTGFASSQLSYLQEVYGEKYL